jgi:hypothetical protein
MEKNDLIYGKKKSDFILNENELEFIKAHTFSQIMNNESKKMKLMNIFKKIGSLSVVQKDVYNILNSFQLNESKNTNSYNNFIKKFIQNQEIENNFRKNEEIGNSIFILYLLLNNIVKYVKRKKIDANENISSRNEEKINKAYKEIRFLIKKFLKLREKIYSMTQLQYIESPIVQNANITNRFYYYHFYRPLIEYIILEKHKINDFVYDYENVKKYLLFKDNVFFYKLNPNNNINNNLNNNLNNKVYSMKYIIYNINEFIKTLNIKIYNSNNNVSNMNIYNLYSIYYINGNIHNIISKRNTHFYLYKYEINNNKIIQSKNPESIYINENNLNQFLEKNHKTYGILQKVFSLYE